VQYLAASLKEEAKMKLTPQSRKLIEFMSSNVGRFVRGLLGAALIVSAVTMGEWYWLLAPFGVFMIFTAAMGYCPTGLLFPAYKEEKITEKFPSYKMDK
jgi:hypothetical protein